MRLLHNVVLNDKEVSEDCVSLTVLIFLCFSVRSALAALLHWCAHYLAALSNFIFAESLVVAITELHLDFAGST